MKKNIKKVIISVAVVICAMLLTVGAIVCVRTLRQPKVQPEEIVEEVTPIEEAPIEEEPAEEELVEETEEVTEEVDPNVVDPNPFEGIVDYTNYEDYDYESNVKVQPPTEEEKAEAKERYDAYQEHLEEAYNYSEAMTKKAELVSMYEQMYEEEMRKAQEEADEQ